MARKKEEEEEELIGVDFRWLDGLAVRSGVKWESYQNKGREAEAEAVR